MITQFHIPYPGSALSAGGPSFFQAFTPEAVARVPDGFRPVADLSTGHYSADDNTALHRLAQKSPLVCEHEYGFFVHTGLAEEWLPCELSTALFSILIHLSACGVPWVQFDQDGPRYADLPWFDW